MTPPDDAPFDEPWQAQAFALTLALHARGLFTWGEWAEALGREIHAPEASADYYVCWLNALEGLLRDKGIA